MNQYTYTGSKIQNHFTAYLIPFVRGKRHDYLEKKIQRADAEELLEDIGQMEAGIVIEELLESQTREQLLLQDEERKLIYQHVFEERTFEEMSRFDEDLYQELISTLLQCIQRFQIME